MFVCVCVWGLLPVGLRCVAEQSPRRRRIAQNTLRRRAVAPRRTWFSVGCRPGIVARWRLSGAWLQLRENGVRGGLRGVTGHVHEKQIEKE